MDYQNANIRIKIIGAQGIGKSVIADLLTEALAEKGYTVTNFDGESLKEIKLQHNCGVAIYTKQKDLDDEYIKGL